ncbi:MAG: C/D box methylation guide ribonucleoprotein complex aNOP56 subunit [Candidatus Bathyarchaeota archaeon]
MKATIVESVIGFFGFGEDNKLIEQVFFSKDPLETAKKLRNIEEGKIIEEISTLINKLKTKGYSNFVFDNKEIVRKIQEKLNIEASFEKSSEASRIFRENFDNFALESKFFKNKDQIRAYIHNVSIELAKIKIKKTIEKRDLLVAQAVQSIDDLDKSLNLFMNRIREWFGLHFPELDRLLDKHETYARLIVNLGERNNFIEEKLEEEGLPKNKSHSIAEVAAASMGADISQDDLVQIQDVSSKVLNLYDLRQSLEGYVDSVMSDVAPNIRAIGGSLLGARLLSMSGGLLNLAKLPASTIQVLGAEKALFRALKTKALPPKHGIIFQHPLIHDAKRWQRGKIARTLSGKLSIAARVDAFNGEFMGDKLKIELEKRIEEIKEKYEKPPVSLHTKKDSGRKIIDRKEPRRKKRGRRR